MFLLQEWWTPGNIARTSQGIYTYDVDTCNLVIAISWPVVQPTFI